MNPPPSAAATSSLRLILKVVYTMALSITNNKICPFGQRLWLTLELSGLPYTFKETSLAPGTKPEWFTAL